MTADVVIRAERLGKKYIIGHESAQERYTTLRDVIGRQGKSLVRTTRDLLRGGAIVAGDTTEEFWALKDINFDVKRGEVVGVIGRNGAGKSTLLKILSRITEPTEGQITINGKVASLLEVGTGFHPELSGRENIYLNGAILGMARGEVRSKFDEIVAFAGVDRFLDTPVKRYSSGMYVRLAFAIAAHLEPEILVIDEVLAVGDTEFQKKCLGKISEVAGGGRTVLFVSHNIGVIPQICDRAIFLCDGKIKADGPAEDIVGKYIREATNSEVLLLHRKDRYGQGGIKVTTIDFWNKDGVQTSSTHSGGFVAIKLHFIKEPDLLVDGIDVSISLRTELDQPVFLQYNRLTGSHFSVLPIAGCFTLSIGSIPLLPGRYRVGYSLMLRGDYLDAIEGAVDLEIVGSDYFGSGELPASSHGCFLVKGDWSLSPDSTTKHENADSVQSEY